MASKLTNLFVTASSPMASKFTSKFSQFSYSRLADIIEEGPGEESEKQEKHIKKESQKRKVISCVLAFLICMSIFCVAVSKAIPTTRLNHLKEATVLHQDALPYRKVVALVFYGRRDRVSILDCYLKRNLVENGGMLDEVKFVVRTDNITDLNYLDSLIETSPSYSRVNLTHPGDKDQTSGHASFGRIWDLCEPGIMYIKLDDDIVYIADDTIPLLIASKVAHPEWLMTSANVINSPVLAYLHYHLGAVKPFLPELSPQVPNFTHDSISTSDNNERDVSWWRPSLLPPWSGPRTFALPNEPSPPPAASHRPQRWLPLLGTSNLSGTPIAQVASPDPWGVAWKSWAIGAQQHYSFLSNLDAATTSKYHFKEWDCREQRLSINMLAVLGDDIVAHPVPGDDEVFLTITLPGALGRPVVVEGAALAAHFSFGPQTEGLEATDLLERYRGVAQEGFCPGGMVLW